MRAWFAFVGQFVNASNVCACRQHVVRALSCWCGVKCSAVGLQQNHIHSIVSSRTERLWWRTQRKNTSKHRHSGKTFCHLYARFHFPCFSTHTNDQCIVYYSVNAAGYLRLTGTQSVQSLTSAMNK